MQNLARLVKSHTETKMCMHAIASCGCVLTSLLGGRETEYRLLKLERDKGHLCGFIKVSMDSDEELENKRLGVLFCPSSIVS